MTVTEGQSVTDAEPRLVSNSEVQAYLECPQKWMLRYVDGFVEPREASGHLSLGTTVHLGLQRAYEDDLNYEAAYQAVVERAEDSLEAFPDQEEAIQKEAELARIMLEGYFQQAEEEGWDADYDVVGLEKTYSMPLPDLDHILGRPVVAVGKVDRLLRDRASELLVVEDYKTTASFADVENIADITWQFRLYPELAQYELGEPVDGTLVTMLRKVKRTASAKPPFYKRHGPLRWRKVERDAFGLQFLGTVTRMLETEKALRDGASRPFHAPARSSRDCTWKCPFYKVCPQAQAGMDLSHLYEVRPPYQRYEGEEA